MGKLLVDNRLVFSRKTSYSIEPLVFTRWSSIMVFFVGKSHLFQKLRLLELVDRYRRLTLDTCHLLHALYMHKNKWQTLYASYILWVKNLSIIRWKKPSLADYWRLSWPKEMWLVIVITGMFNDGLAIIGRKIHL